MSSALVRKSLALVDTDSPSAGKRKQKKSKANNILNFIPDNQKLFRRINKKGHAGKVNLLKGSKKLTVTEARKLRKSKEERLKENLEKIRLIHEVCTFELGEEVTKQIIERAVTRRPLEYNNKKEEESKTVFTEEDFKKFEEEYVDES